MSQCSLDDRVFVDFSMSFLEKVAITFETTKTINGNSNLLYLFNFCYFQERFYVQCT